MPTQTVSELEKLTIAAYAAKGCAFVAAMALAFSALSPCTAFGMSESARQLANRLASEYGGVGVKKWIGKTNGVATEAAERPSGGFCFARATPSFTPPLTHSLTFIKTTIKEKHQ